MGWRLQSKCVRKGGGGNGECCPGPKIGEKQQQIDCKEKNVHVEATVGDMAWRLQSEHGRGGDGVLPPGQKLVTTQRNASSKHQVCPLKGPATTRTPLQSGGYARIRSRRDHLIDSLVAVIQVLLHPSQIHWFRKSSRRLLHVSADPHNTKSTSRKCRHPSGSAHYLSGIRSQHQPPFRRDAIERAGLASRAAG